MDVEASKTYLVRFVGAQALTYLRYKLADHNFTIVQVDGGSYVKPLEVDHIELAGGQRYAALLTTKSEEELERLGISVFLANISSYYRSGVVEGYALLRYQRDKKEAPRELMFGLHGEQRSAIPQVPKSEFGWIDRKLEPLYQKGYPLHIDQRISSDTALISRYHSQRLADERHCFPKTVSLGSQSILLY